VSHDLEMFLLRIRHAPFARDPHALSDQRRQRRLDLGIEQRESFLDVPSQTRHPITQVLPLAAVERGESEQLRWQPEYAVRLVEANSGESVVLTLGPPEAVEQLRGDAVNQVDGAEVALVTGGPAGLPVSGTLLRR